MEFPGERLLLRLWDTLAEKGVGSLLRPWQLRREGRAQIDLRREEILALAQAERDAEDIRIGRKRFASDGTLIALPAAPSVPIPDPPVSGPEEDRFLRDAAQIANASLVRDAIRREVNVGKAVLAAEAELETDPQQPPERNLNDDWLFRWRDCASEVSSEELQSLWGRLLAGEVKSPGTFSLRALDFLRNLSTQEATDITKLSRFVVAGVIFRGDGKLLEDEGVTFDFLLAMQQLGVLDGVGGLAHVSLIEQGHDV